MTSAPRRLILFAVASISGVGLLIVLLLLFSQPPRPVTSAIGSATATPRTVAIIDDEPLLLDDWWRAVALDQAMSGLTDQEIPSPEETLDRLINERLVLRAAQKAGIPPADRAQAEAWLVSFLQLWGLDEEALEEALARVGLTRADLLGEFVPRLLRVQTALESIPTDGDSEAWVADLQRQAKVELLENLALNLPPESTAVAALSSTRSPAQPTSFTTEGGTAPRVGGRAPDFRLESFDGATVRLADLRGRSVLLNFWATWCAPCRTELSTLQALQDDDLVILGIAVRESWDAVDAVSRDLGLEIPLLLDEKGETTDLYQVRGLPTSLFVDREGMILGRHVGPLDQQTLDNFLNALLTSPPSATDVP